MRQRDRETHTHTHPHTHTHTHPHTHTHTIFHVCMRCCLESTTHTTSCGVVLCKSAFACKRDIHWWIVDCVSWCCWEKDCRWHQVLFGDSSQIALHVGYQQTLLCACVRTGVSNQATFSFSCVFLFCLFFFSFLRLLAMHAA